MAILFSFLKSNAALSFDDFKSKSQDFIAALNLSRIKEFDPSKEITKAKDRETVRRVLVKANLLKVFPEKRALIFQPINPIEGSEPVADYYHLRHILDNNVRVDTLILMLLQGIGPDVPEEFGLNLSWTHDWTLLMYAACWDSVCVQVVLAGGADPDIKTGTGHTALMYSAKFNHIKCVQVLLAGGADPNVQIGRVDTALTMAAYWKNSKCVNVLADHQIANALTICTAKKDKEIEKQRVLNLVFNTLEGPGKKNVDGKRLAVSKADKNKAWDRVKERVIAKLFALIVFLSDRLFKTKRLSPELSEKEQKAKRFLDMAEKLPMELQMVLCFRAVGSGKDIVLMKDSEPEFRELGWRCGP